MGTWGAPVIKGATAGTTWPGKEAVYTGTLPENIPPSSTALCQMGDIQPKEGRFAIAPSVIPGGEATICWSFRIAAWWGPT